MEIINPPKVKMPAAQRRSMNRQRKQIVEDLHRLAEWADNLCRLERGEPMRHDVSREFMEKRFELLAKEAQISGTTKVRCVFCDDWMKSPGHLRKHFDRLHRPEILAMKGTPFIEETPLKIAQ
jgi:hypothetical protein